MKMAKKREKDEILVITLKHVSSLMGVLNFPGTPKLWEITKENGDNMRKLRDFGPNSQTCIGSYDP